MPGEVVFVPGTDMKGREDSRRQITNVDYTPESFIQGHTMVMKVKALLRISTVQGALGEYPLNFFTEDGETYLALQGLHAKESTGIEAAINFWHPSGWYTVCPYPDGRSGQRKLSL